MSRRPLLLIPLLSLVALLSACAGPMPQPDPSEAWIGLQEEAPNDLLAERVDGRNIDDGRYFQVRPGAHRLDVTLFEEPAGDANQEDCTGHISYSAFKAGEHYTLVESSLGQSVSAQLLDSHGKPLARSEDFNCMPG